MPCPVPDLKKKKKDATYQPGWKKGYMIDLNTLDTTEKWVNKLTNINQNSIKAMRAALKQLRM